MNGTVCFLTGLLMALLLALSWYHEDVSKSMTDFQAYTKEITMPKEIQNF